MIAFLDYRSHQIFKNCYSKANRSPFTGVTFVYAQPTGELFPGIEKPEIDAGASIEIKEWPEGLQEIASQLGVLATED